MDERSGLLKISHDRAIGDLILAADQGHVPDGDHVVEVVGVAVVGPVVSQKADHVLNLGPKAKIDHVPDLKAGSLDQRVSLS